MQHRANDANHTGTVDLEIATEGPEQEFGFLSVLDVRVMEVEAQLSMRIGRRQLTQVTHRSLGHVFLKQRSARNGCVEHELVEFRAVIDRVLDGRVDVLGRVFLQSDDARTQHAYAMLSQPANKFNRVDARQLLVLRVLSFQSHPHPGDTQGHQLLDRVLLQDIRRAEQVERPRFVVLLHLLQQLERAWSVDQKIFVHHEERPHAQVRFQLAHDVEQLIATLVELDELSFATKHGGSRAEIAAHRATGRWDQRRRRHLPGDCAA